MKNDNVNDDQNRSAENEFDENKPLPGEYPPGEDIMNRRNEFDRVDVDTNQMDRRGRVSTPSAEETEETTAIPEDDQIIRGPSNLTREDLEALGPADLSMDMGEDEEVLKHRPWPVDFAARDLDVPSGDDERIDALGQGDEENDHYSLGSDRHDNLEDDTTPTL